MNIIIPIDELDVTKNFLPGNGLTHCNQFIIALCKKLGIKILEDKANAQFDWLDTFSAGKENWRACSRTDAQGFANQGQLVVVAYRNNDLPAEKAHGHIAVIHPCAVLVKEPFIHITQAGGENFVNGPLARGFGFKPVKFWSNKGPFSS